MDKIRIGIICPSEIAFRRFMPAITKCTDFDYVGVAVPQADEWGGAFSNETREIELSKAKDFVASYGGKIFASYNELIESNEIDAVYLPLPPSLHYKWGRKVLENGKHLFVEKPSTTCYKDTEELVKFALGKGLALHENYMFRFHSQIEYIKDFIESGKIGDIRLYKIAFGFPKRASNDFRYNKMLGGGALLDAGGYTFRLASILLGDTVKVVTSKLNYTDEFDVDLFGSATLENAEGLIAQVSFGMDNAYKCELEVWGSKGTLFTNRILTAPVGFEPIIEYKDGNNPIEKIRLSEDDTFMKSIMYFEKCIYDQKIRNKSYNSILKQAELVEKVKGCN